MKVQFAILFVLIAPSLSLWPVPKSYTNGTGVFWLSPSVELTFNGATLMCDAEKAPQENLLANLRSDTFAQYTVQRALFTIFTDNFVPWKLHPRGSNFEPNGTSSKKFITSIHIKQISTNLTGTLKPPADGVDESYELDIDQGGIVTVSSNTSTGLIHAMSTFTQLFYQHTRDNQDVYTNLIPITIRDSPKFQHRGLNLDVARNWYPVSSILHTIDALAWNKFNFLHLHITDSQSWPLQIPTLPELATKGAYNTGLSYSPKDLSSIQQYGLSRGIQVVLEIDMPGHTSAIGLSHPELVAALDVQPDWSTYCAEPPCGTLKLNSSAVDTFIHKLLADLLPRLVPGSSYFHSGGDEINVQAYLLDETVKSNSSAVIKPLLQRFIDNVHDQVRSAGLTPIVWEEMLLMWNLTLGKDVVIQTWQTDEAVANATSLGYKTLFGNYNFWYLDCGHGQWLDFTEGASFAQFYPFKDYCSPYKNWKLVYTYDPLHNLSPAQAQLVIGGEVHMWSEQTDPVNLDANVWPRAAAAAENLWSGRTDDSGRNRTLLDASPRLAEMRERLVARGVGAGPVQMVFCTQHDASECSL